MWERLMKSALTMITAAILECDKHLNCQTNVIINHCNHEHFLEVQINPQVTKIEQGQF